MHDAQLHRNLISAPTLNLLLKHLDRPMISYSKSEGLLTPWSWSNALLCYLFGHPPRSFHIWGSQNIYPVCARCGRPVSRET